MPSLPKLHCIFIALYVACAATAGSAEDEDQASSESQARKQRQEVMRVVMSKVRVFEKLNDKEVELDRGDQAITHYSDSTRDYEDGTLWAFTRNGRPLALTTCYTRDVNTGRWIHATTSLSTNPLRCTQNDAVIWTPRTAGITFAPLPDAPDAPDAATGATRLSQQIRQVARRFEAWQFWDPDNQRYELRRQARPAIEYTDKSTGVAAGAVFLFTHGVNPELVLLIEAVGQEKPTWRYAFAKIGAAEFHATLDGREVYESDRAPGVVGRWTDPYFMFFSRSHVTAKEILNTIKSLQ